jgi:hypothetical protein
VKRDGHGVRILVCQLPIKSPWRGTFWVPIEPTWIHPKRQVAEPAGLLTADELEQRVCAALGCPVEDHLGLPKKVACVYTSQPARLDGVALDAANCPAPGRTRHRRGQSGRGRESGRVDGCRQRRRRRPLGLLDGARQTGTRARPDP